MAGNLTFTGESKRQLQPSAVRRQPASTRQRQTGPVVKIHGSVSNRALQRLLAQRSSAAPTELDDATADRIHRARGGGASLDAVVQAQLGNAMGADFGHVRVHTGGESHALNEQLSARAFTTGSDIFFRDGAYDPHSSSGQELLAHELTHVVQQQSGAVPSSGKMAVNAPGDRFEQEADAVARAVTSSGAAPDVQRQEVPEEELQAMALQRQQVPDEELQAMHLQRQEVPEDEEAVQMQELPEEELEAA